MTITIIIIVIIVVFLLWGAPARARDNDPNVPAHPGDHAMGSDDAGPFWINPGLSSHVDTAAAHESGLDTDFDHGAGGDFGGGGSSGDWSGDSDGSGDGGGDSGGGD